MAIQHNKVDVVTVGAGWTSTIVGWLLGEAGVDLVALEQGPWRWSNPDFEKDHDQLRYHVRHAMMMDLSKETWTWRPNPHAPTLPMRQYGSFNPGSGVGGAAIHWSGMLWRFLPTDFKYRTHHIERYGAQKLPEGNRIRDWPVSYDELEPYFDRFEYDIGTSGQAGNLNGQLIEGGNIFEGPRKRPYPLPPLADTVGGQMFARAAKALGWHPFPQPAGILSRAYRDATGTMRSGCLYCGFCTRFGCEVDAKSSPQTTHLPLALNTGRYEVRTNSKVLRVDTSPSGMATGVTYMDDQGQEHFQPADMVILSAYTLTNVRLLLLSKGGKHPQGIGNDRGLVGTNYTYQLWETLAKGVFKNHEFNRFMGNTSTCQICYDFNADNFDHSSVDFVGGGSLMSPFGEYDPLTSVGSYPVAGAGTGGGTSAAEKQEKKERSWGKDWKEALRNTWDRIAPITTQGESLPYEDQYLDLDPVYKDSFGLPLLRLTFDWHRNDYNVFRYLAARAKELLKEMGADDIDSDDELKPYNIHAYQSTHCTGGAIMGTDPGNSVTNKYGQVWDTPNVFVTGAALYPQNAGANPTGTLGALAYLAAEAIRDRYLKHPGQVMD